MFLMESGWIEALQPTVNKEVTDHSTDISIKPVYIDKDVTDHGPEILIDPVYYPVYE